MSATINEWLVEIRPFPLAVISANSVYSALEVYLSTFKISSKRLKFLSALVDSHEHIIRAA